MKKRFFPFTMAVCMACLLTMTSCLAAEAPAAGNGAAQNTATLTSETQPVTAFTDVPAGAWYAEAVDYVRKHELMNGVGEGRFAPEETLTRAMLVTILWRQAGEPVVNYLMQFSDVPEGQWYSEAVRWAASEKLVQGYGNGRFGTNDPITQEQLDLIFQRYTSQPVTDGIPGFDGSTKPATRVQAAAAVMNYAQLPQQTPSGGKILVAYFSATGNTRPLAEYAADILGADLFEIVPEVPYTAADLAYYTDCRADREQKDASARPAIAGNVENMADYDVVLVGYPIWHGQPPRIISTFLESYDFTGKTIVPFCTSHSSGYSDSTIKPLTPGASWLTGRRFAGGADRSAMEEWINGLDLPAKEETALPYDGVYPQHEPYGKGIGAMPGRVVWTHDPDSVEWDGSGYWWEMSHFDEAAIRAMVDTGIASLGGKDTAREGWAALFRAHNGGSGYAPGEKIAIKANINGSGVYDDDTSGKTNMSYTNPALLKALLASLVEEAGAAPSDITVYDVSRLFPDYMVERCTAGNLRGVNFVGRNNGTADENAPILWSREFSGRVNYLPTCVTQAEYVINLANLKGHSYGITLCGKNHFGSFLNGNLMRPPEGANLHQWLTRNEMGLYSPLADLMANADLGGKTVLYMLDALICAPSEGASITAENSRWQQEPFNGHYTASVFVSQDPVAIDSVGADFLMNEPTVISRNGSLRDNPTVENYLHEAGLVSAPPSGTSYTDSLGHTVDNLGVHEHWNNSTQRQYSRNLGKSEGIELVELSN